MLDVPGSLGVDSAMNISERPLLTPASVAGRATIATAREDRKGSQVEGAAHILTYKDKGATKGTKLKAKKKVIQQGELYT